VAFTRDDRRLIMFTGGAVVLAALFFAAVLVFATPSDRPTKEESGPLYIGQASDLREKLDLGSPLYFASPFGGSGFWLGRENGEFVSLDVRLPGADDCNVVWRGRRDTYVDCNGDAVTSAELARYATSVVRRGEQKGAVYVDLNRLIDAPNSGV
jgi:hypothetical protein